MTTGMVPACDVSGSDDDGGDSNGIPSSVFGDFVGADAFLGDIWCSNVGVVDVIDEDEMFPTFLFVFDLTSKWEFC